MTRAASLYLSLALAGLLASSACKVDGTTVVADSGGDHDQVSDPKATLDNSTIELAEPADPSVTYAAWFRAVAKKYPHKKPAEILDDLVAETPGEEGKWFAAAKGAKLFDEAIALANRTPCSPQTLSRAARDFEEKKPEFAIEAGMAALRWLVEGYGYDITGLDVLDAYSHTMKAAENAGCAEETQRRIHDLVARESFGERFVTKVLGRQLGLS